jgi:hypothetical protein
MKTPLYIFKDMFSPSYSHLDLYDVSKSIITENVFKKIKDIENELNTIHLKGEKIDFLISFLKTIKQRIETKYHFDSDTICEFDKLLSLMHYNLEYENRELHIVDYTLDCFFYDFTFKYRIIIDYPQYDTIISDKENFEAIDAENYDTNQIETLIQELDLDFEIISNSIVYKYFLNKYHDVFDYEDLESIQENIIDLKTTRKLIILEELGILDKIKELNQFQDYSSVGYEIAKLLNINKEHSARIVGSIKHNMDSKNNPYNAKGNKEFIKRLRDLLS